mmetsp:Transcript_24184/g.37203  ORF Transcript_24184/g.37203 Transcript_24184/m.37203 type:complete len:146 (+) Transcript_24184:4050-4487(+)
MKFVNKERVPTATLLIRVLTAPKHETGKPINLGDFPLEDQIRKAYEAPPEYKEGVYNNMYINLANDEKTIMKLRRRRPNPALEDVLSEIIRLANKNPENMSFVDKQVFLSQYISFTNKNVPSIDLNYHSQYERRLGFRVAVEAIH